MTIPEQCGTVCPFTKELACNPDCLLLALKPSKVSKYYSIRWDTRVDPEKGWEYREPDPSFEMGSYNNVYLNPICVLCKRNGNVKEEPICRNICAGRSTYRRNYFVPNRSPLLKPPYIETFLWPSCGQCTFEDKKTNDQAPCKYCQTKDQHSFYIPKELVIPPK